MLSKNTDSSEVSSLAGQLKIAPVIASVLLNRNIKSSDAAAFLNKSIKNVHHPYLLKDAQKAAERICSAIKTKEKIVIYGDYDVDGITSTAILYMFLTELGANTDFYIPNRSDEGYGINMLALQKIKNSGASLLITVDCGITAVGEVELAKAMGLTVIVTDHHTCKQIIPNAYAVVNPKQPDCTYPFKDLAGVGVAFKLILAVALCLGLSAKEYFDKFIDIVAIGTIADVVSLTDENRIFVAAGLGSLKNTQNLGLKALFKSASISDKPINTSLISFMIAPRINAAGRVGSAKSAVELLVTKSAERAEQIAFALEDENHARQSREQQILTQANEMIDADASFKEKNVIVLAKENWHHGVIGVVASRLVDKYYKPAILISLKDGLGKGSGRSIKGFNLFDALTDCSDLLLKYGGHELAAGLGVSESDIPALEKKINEYAKTHLSEEDLTPYINIDAILSLGDLTVENAQMLSILEPFGMGNPQPVFAAKNVTLIVQRAIGDGRHTRLTVSQNGKNIDALGFNMTQALSGFVIGSKLDIAFTLSTNVFRGEKHLQVILKDVRLSVK